MFDALFQLDAEVFFYINRDLHNVVFDWLMPVITNQRHWYPLFLAAFVYLIWKGGRTGRTAAALIILVIALSDQISSSLLKPWVHRLRPCTILDGVRMLPGIACANYSFPSSHATNAFAAATFFAHYYPQVRWTLFTFAFLAAFSRIYLGVHYPSDVVGGALLGALCAWSVIYLYKFAERVYQNRRQRTS
ncbi:phosphatase PAP2 family protein [candidate division KSB1 bacterium]|nr:phosphatase PAP2 family protein [candidate division KSB1 bacterium]